jgi:hypothetical protein
MSDINTFSADPQNVHNTALITKVSEESIKLFEQCREIAKEIGIPSDPGMVNYGMPFNTWNYLASMMSNNQRCNNGLSIAHLYLIICTIIKHEITSIPHFNHDARKNYELTIRNYVEILSNIVEENRGLCFTGLFNSIYISIGILSPAHAIEVPSTPRISDLVIRLIEKNQNLTNEDLAALVRIELKKRFIDPNIIAEWVQSVLEM